MAMLKKMKSWFQTADRKRRDFVVRSLAYTQEYPEELIILADTKLDVLVMAYKDLCVPMHFRDKAGKATNTIDNSLNYRKINNSVNNFLRVIDSQLAAIATTLYNRKHKTNHPTKEYVFQKPPQVEQKKAGEELSTSEAETKGV